VLVVVGGWVVGWFCVFLYWSWLLGLFCGIFVLLEVFFC